MEEIKEEIWKKIDGYDNYMISNYGRVKSLGNNKTRKEKVLNLLVNSNGYLFVFLCKNGKSEQCLVHRLVSQAFIPNTDPENKNFVDHINTIKTDNRSENLRWCTQKENCNNETSKKNYSLAKKNKHWKLVDGKRVWY